MLILIKHVVTNISYPFIEKTIKARECIQYIFIYFKYEYYIRATECTRNSYLFPNTIASQEFPDTSR